MSSFARGLTVICAFNRAHPAMTLTEVAAAAGITRATARRFLLTLVREGYAETDGRYFRLRPKILELGFSALSSIAFSEVAQPIMNDLAQELGEMCLAAVLDGYSVVYVNRTVSRHLLSVNLEVGSRLPAFCMSTGRVLLGALSDRELDEWLANLHPIKYTAKTIVSPSKLRKSIKDARSNGWAIMDEEYEEGFRSLSVPIHDRAGATIAALNVCCPSNRVSLDSMRSDLCPLVLRAAASIRDALPEENNRSLVDFGRSSTQFEPAAQPDKGVPRTNGQRASSL